MENEKEVSQPELINNAEQDVDVDNQIEATQVQEQPFLKVKFNKEEKGLSADEAIEYAQKGLNYDHVKGEYEALKGSKSFKLIEKMAKKSGMTEDEYVDYVEQQEELMRIQELASKNGIEDNEFAKRFYELEQKANKFDEYQKENETKTQAETRKQAEYNEFFDFYRSEYGTDVKAEDIPAEVFELTSKGKTLTDAFVTYQFKQLKKGQAVEKKNEENSKTSTGSISGNGSTQEVVFTTDYIANMTEKEMSKQWNNPAFRKAVGLK